MKKIATILFVLLSTLVFSQNFAGGDGTSGDPWQISTPDQLDEVHNYLGSSHTDKYFVLINDIDLTDYLANGGDGYTQWGASGWLPIGDMWDSFEGTFDGDGHTIIGLMINNSSEYYIGLFGYSQNSVIKNVNLINVNVNELSDNSAGSIVGYNKGEIDNVHSQGDVSGSDYTGGLTAFNSGTISNCSAEGTVTGTEQIAGLIGFNSGTIQDSHADVYVVGANIVGGLVGYNNGGTIESSYTTGNVDADGYIGGIAGVHNGGSITTCAAFGNISGTGTYIGGLIGIIYAGTITNNYAHGTAIGPTNLDGQFIGGLVGGNDGSIALAYAIGSAIGGSNVGGLVGGNGLYTTSANSQDAYWDTQTTGHSNALGSNAGTSSNLIGRTTIEMLGSAASTNMPSLDFTSIWETVEASQADATGNGYPILTGIDRLVQLQEQGLLATFQLSMSASPVAGGSISGDGTYNPGETIPIEATATEGYTFIEWTGDITNVDNPTNATANVTMPAADVTLTANFEAIDYTLTVDINPAEGGNITGNGTYNFGDVASLTATANEGYQFINWTDGGGTEISNQAAYDYTMPSEDVTLNANFEAIDYTLTVDINPTEGGNITGNGTYNFGDVASLTATANEGYQFINWTDGGGTEISNQAAYDYTMPSEDVTLTANFEAIDYTLTVDINPTEGGNITGNGTYNFGDVASLTATANEGYQFINWTDGGGTEISNQAAYDYTMPSEDVTLTANFDAIDYSVNANISPSAAGTVTGEGVYNMGDLVSLSVTENTGYEFLNWTDTAHTEVLSEAIPYEFSMVANDTSATANFGLETLHALDFDSVDDYVSIPHSDNFNVGNTVSVEAWIYPTDLAGRFTVFSTRNQNLPGSWQLEVGAGDGDHNMVAVTGINTWVIVSENDVIKENCWQHITFVRGATGDKLFVNGNEVTLQQQTFYNFADNQSIKTIGVGTNGAAPFQGKIDEVRVWNVARTAEEIKQNFRTNLVGDEAGLAAYYKFDEGVGNYTFDNSQNSNIGTLTGTPTWITEDFKNLFALTVNEAPLGSTDINSNPIQFSNLGDEVTIFTTPIRGFEFTEWTGDIENITTGNVNSDTVTVTMPNHDIALTANCTELDQYMLTLVAQPTEGGNVIGSGNQYVGLDTLISAKIKWGYTFVNWTNEDGDTVSSEAEFYYQMPAKDVILTANFATQTPTALPFVENFNAQTLPYNWAVEDQIDHFATTTWTFVDNFTNGIFPAGSINGTTFAIIANDRLGAQMNSVLYTPIVDAGNIADSTLLLSFEHFYLHIMEGSATVDVWDGSAWQNVAFFTDFLGDWGNPEIQNINITAFANDQLVVRFQYTDPNINPWWWAIDNVKIEAFSSIAEILDFSLTQQTAPALIDSASASVQIEVLYGTDVTNLAPIITVSDGATITPASGAGNDFTNPVTYTVTAEDGITTKSWTVNVTTASATAKILSLNTNPTDIGSITGMGSYEVGDPVEIIATTETGYEFVNWTDELDNEMSTSAAYSFNMPDADLTLTANFSLIDYMVNVTVTPTNSGVISGDETYNMDDAVSLTATANEGYTFINWTNSGGTVVSENMTYNFTMPAENVEINANFEAIDYNLTLAATPVEGGTVSGNGVFNIGDLASVSATANEGYQFVNWTNEGGTEVSTQAAFDYAMPAADVLLTANFELIDYNLTLAAAPVEGGTISGDGVFNIGDMASISATANEGYQFVNWTNEGGTEVSTQAAFDYTMPAADVLLTANFELIDYNLTLTATPVEGGTTSGDGVYNMGDMASVSATANEGYQFVNWTDEGGTEVSTQAAFDYTMPAADVLLTANFELIDYDLTLTATPVEGGTTSGDGVYNMGDMASVSATANEGYQFVNWTNEGGTEVSTQAAFDYTMPAADVLLTANFELIDYNLTLAATPVEGGTVSGDGVFNIGDMANISATANEGYQFVNWTDEGGTEVSTQAAFDYTMPAADVLLTANFELIDYMVNVTIAPTNGGTITGDGTYNMGDEVTLTATANEGYAFINWTDSENIEVSVNAAYTFTMPAENVDLTANFEAIDYNLSLEATPVEGGTVTGEGVFNIGDMASVSATANEGYQFVNWTNEGGTEVSTQAAFDYTMPAADVLLTANFELIDYLVNVTIAPTNGGTIIGDGTYNMGDEVTLTATANEGYTFINWTDSESSVVSADATYIFTMPAGNVELSANFGAIDYNLTLESTPTEGGTVTGEGVFNIGDMASVSATANEGYQFVNWTDEGGSEVSTQAAFDYTMPAADVLLTANFELIDYLVNVTIAPTNGGTIIGNGTYNMGDEVTLTATANEGYTFINWTDSESSVVSTDSTYIFTMPAADINLIANFDDESSINEYSKGSISLYPNPAKTDLNIIAETQIIELQVFNSSGELLLKQKVNNTEYVLPVSEIRSGMYFIRIETNKGFVVKKFQVIE